MPIGSEMDEQDQEALESFVTKKRTQKMDRVQPGAICSLLYQPLMDGETRVLELYPAVYEDPLAGNLHVVSIDFAYPPKLEFEQPTRYNTTPTTWTRHTNHAVELGSGRPFWYTALSYVWGLGGFDQMVRLERGDIPITSSLATALRHLRTSGHSIFLWIDQICMNQSDKLEMAQQIPLMGKIYSHATNTIIWLGDGKDSDPSLAFNTMETVYSRLQSSDGEVTPDDFQRLVFPPALDRSWWAVRQLLRTPWFTRLWTIQEAILSRNLYVKWGKMEADWDDIAAWCFQLKESSILDWLVRNDALDCEYFSPLSAYRWIPAAGTVMNSLQADRLIFMSLGPGDILGILVSTRYAQATQPKDKIYGVLGIAETNIIPRLSDKVTAREVYHEVCLTLVHVSMHELLSCVDHETPLSLSWVPDWSVPRVTETLGYFTKTRHLYYAGKSSLQVPVIYGRPGYKIGISENKKRITLCGKLVDKVSVLASVSYHPSLDINRLENTTLDTTKPQIENPELASYIALVKARYSSDQNQEYPASSTTIYNAFFQTLVAGRDASGTATPSVEHSEVFSLILDSSTGLNPSLPGQKYSSRREKGYFKLESLKTRRPAKALEDLRIAMRAALKMRRFAITEKGYFALVPRGAEVGDEIVVFHKAAVPFVVREAIGSESGEARLGYEVLGESYVHGIMHGETMEMMDLEMVDLTLV